MKKKRLSGGGGFTPRNFTNFQGFTIMEVIIAASIGIVVLSAVLFLFIRGNQMFIFDSRYLDTQKNVRLVLDNISQDTRRAGDVVSSAIGSVPASTLQQLVLEVSSIDASGNPITGSNDYFRYTLNSTTSVLEKTTWAAVGSTRTSGTQNISLNISNLAFGYLPTLAGATRITISITSTATVMNKTHTKTLNTSVKLRNK